MAARSIPKQCYVCMCMFVWPSSYTSRKYKIQYSVQHGLVRLCGHCVYCEAEMAAAECPPQILGIIPQTPNTQHTIFWTLPPENTLQSPTFSAAINEERTSLGATGWQKVMVTHFLSLAARTQFVNITSTAGTGLIINQPRPENKIFPVGCKICWKL